MLDENRIKGSRVLVIDLLLHLPAQTPAPEVYTRPPPPPREKKPGQLEQWQVRPFGAIQSRSQTLYLIPDDHILNVQSQQHYLLVEGYMHVLEA